MDAMQAITVLNMVECHGGPTAKAKELAIDALEKNVPQKPYMESDGDADGYPVWDYYCPICNHYFDEEQPRYCPDCGQKIDWEEG